VRIGVLLSGISAFAVVGHVLSTESPGRQHAVVLVLSGLVILGCSALLLLPPAQMMRDRRGPTLVHLWSAGSAALALLGLRLDGGSSSPLDALPILTLAVMAALTMVWALASANSRAARDRRVVPVRTRGIPAATDPLTGAPDRRAFLDRVAAAVDAAAWGHPTVLCRVELDAFEAVNDVAGRAAGDALLTAVGSALAAAVRETDTVARLGGEEFAVLADVSVSFSGEMLAERLRAAVATVGRASGVTASVGLTEVEPGDDVADLMHRADAAMHRSKTAGGNRVTSLSF
jgi:diguanylate cyclase (GGDEF)-like protein